MADNIKSPAQALRAAAQRLRAAESALEAIAKTADQMEATAPDGTPGKTAALAAALEDVAAAHALGEASAAAVKDAAAALAAARAEERAAADDRAATDAAAAGLRRRLQQAEADVDSARAAMEERQREWLLAGMAEAEAAYLEAANAAAQSYGRHAALADALVRRGGKLSNPVALAAGLVLPTLGPESCAAYSAARPQEHGIGANLLGVLLSKADAFNPDAEIESLIASPQRSR